MILADAFDHVVDSTYWHISDSPPFGWNLPFGLSKFVVLELLAAGLILAFNILFYDEKRRSKH